MPVALFSLEMSETELAHRFLASQARCRATTSARAGCAPRSGRRCSRPWRSWHARRSSSTTRATWACWSCAPSRAGCAARHGLGLVIVDYLQLMRPEGRAESSRVEQIGQISRGLKILARELNVPVIAVSQLSRAVESRNPPSARCSPTSASPARSSRTPTSSCSSTATSTTTTELRAPGEAEIIVAKHRNGPVGKVALAFMPNAIRSSRTCSATRGAEPMPQDAASDGLWPYT